MNIIEETYLHILSDSSFSDERFSESIIGESVYAYEELKPLIDDIYSKIISYKHCISNGEEILSLLNLNRKKLKKFNPNSILYVSFFKFIDELDILTDDQIEDVKRRMRDDDGLLVSDFSGKDEFLIVIKKFFDSNSIFTVLYHELIHFLQISTGMKIHDILKCKESISKNDVLSISETLGMNPGIVRDAFGYFYKKTEFEAFIANIFLELRRFFEENDISFTREIFHRVLDSFKQKDKVDFYEYFFNVNRSLALVNLKLSKLSSLKFFRLMYIYGYFRKGFLTVKTHLFGYLDKMNDLT